MTDGGAAVEAPAMQTTISGAGHRRFLFQQKFHVRDGSGRREVEGVGVIGDIPQSHLFCRITGQHQLAIPADCDGGRRSGKAGDIRQRMDRRQVKHLDQPVSPTRGQSVSIRGNSQGKNRTGVG